MQREHLGRSKLPSAMQESFARHVANGFSIADSYAAAGYSTIGRGPVWNGAKLLKQAAVADRVDYLRQQLAADSETELVAAATEDDDLRMWTKKSELIRRLVELYHDAKEAQSFSIQHRALETLAKMQGFLSEPRQPPAPKSVTNKTLNVAALDSKIIDRLIASFPDPDELDQLA